MAQVQTWPGPPPYVTHPQPHLKVQQVPYLLQGWQDLGSMLAGTSMKVPELGLERWGNGARDRTEADIR